MKIPYSWLGEYVDIADLTPARLAELLVGIGFEVEEIVYTGENIENVVSAKILDVKPHPEADRLFVCMVDVGSEITTIVTNAKNVAAGDIVPVARVGARLPSGKDIAEAELRGVTSYGMFCSGKELGVDNSVVDGAEAEGILKLSPDTVLGEDIKSVLGLDEYVLDISVTANRGDCQSVYGIAREVSALLGRKLKALDLKYKVSEAEREIPTVTLSSQACSVYTGALIENVKIAPSPEWMKKRLRLCGIRPISNVVDITNYVLLEVGQPLHAFDLDILKGGINVREALAGEKLKALNGECYSLRGDMLLIADDAKALAIAGVMGGEDSGVTQSTSAVFLESARFLRGSVRTTSRALGLRSDSSARFEKGVDYSCVEAGRERALALFAKLNAGKVTQKRSESRNTEAAVKIIDTSAEQICALLGIAIKTPVIVKILKALSFGVEQKGSELKVSVPLFREDVDNYTDLAEEVIRFYGYDNIESTLMLTAKTTVGGLSVKDRNISALKKTLNCFSCSEVATYSFINQKAYDKLEMPEGDALRQTIRLINPLSEEFAVMRTQLASSMLSVMSLNINRKNTEFRLFDVSKIFIAKSLPLTELPEERDVLCLGFAGGEESFYTVKEVVTALLQNSGVEYKLQYATKCYLHPGVSADIVCNGEIIGWMGKVHPKVAKNYDLPENVYIAELELARLVDEPRRLVRFSPLPKFPEMQRDMAFIVDKSVAVGDVIDLIRTETGKLCERAELFDEYCGEQIEKGSKSLAFNVVYRAMDRTLTDAEVSALAEKAIKAVSEKFGARLRDK